MRRALVLASALGAAGVILACASFSAEDDRDRNAESAEGGAGPDVVPGCSDTAPFQAPVPVAGLADLPAYGLRLSGSETETYFEGPGPGGTDIFVATRATPQGSFGKPNVLSINSSAVDANPMLTADGMTIVFTSTRSASKYALYRATREDLRAAFGDPRPIGALSTGDHETEPFLSTDGSEIFFSSYAEGVRQQIYRAVKEGDQFGAGAPVGGVNLATANNGTPVLSADASTLYFASDRTGIVAIYKSTRARAGGPFSQADPVPEFASATVEHYPSWLSPDGCRLYLMRRTPGLERSAYVAEKRR